MWPLLALEVVDAYDVDGDLELSETEVSMGC